jgi:transcriptional regulator with GAF, ATPase, and Fis domain
VRLPIIIPCNLSHHDGTGISVSELCLDDVLINEQLLQREPRPARLDLEIEALHHLMQQFVKDSRTFLDAVVETTCRLCGGDSAGISVEETLPDESKRLRWVATVGMASEMRDWTMPRFDSPCGIVMDRNSPQLFHKPHRYFRDIPENFEFDEALLVPWRVNDEIRGTLWVQSYRNGKHFDREDLRLVESLRAFAQAAVWKQQMEVDQRNQSARAASAELANALAHQINNPLQALTNSLHLVHCEDHPEVLQGAWAQLARISELVQHILTAASGAARS